MISYDKASKMEHTVRCDFTRAGHSHAARAEGLGGGIHETLLPAQTESKPIAVVDLVALMLHEHEEVAEIVGIRNCVTQVRFQHGTERRLTFGLTEPFNIADSFGGLALHNDGQPMLPAELIRNCANLLVSLMGIRSLRFLSMLSILHPFMCQVKYTEVSWTVFGASFSSNSSSFVKSSMRPLLMPNGKHPPSFGLMCFSNTVSYLM